MVSGQVHSLEQVSPFWYVCRSDFWKINENLPKWTMTTAPQLAPILCPLTSSLELKGVYYSPGFLTQVPTATEHPGFIRCRLRTAEPLNFCSDTMLYGGWDVINFFCTKLQACFHCVRATQQFSSRCLMMLSQPKKSLHERKVRWKLGGG